MGHQITHKRLSNGRGHEHITRLRWRNDQTGETGDNARADMVRFVDERSAGAVYTSSGGNRVTVGTIHPDTGPAYLRTYADGKWNNNLLALPDF